MTRSRQTRRRRRRRLRRPRLSRQSLDLLSLPGSPRSELRPPKPRTLESPARRPVRLDPSKLFNKSSLGSYLERKHSGSRKFHFHHHRLEICGGRAGRVLNSSGDPKFAGNARCGEPHELHETLRTNLWYYHSDSLVNIADSYIHEACRQFLTVGRLWTGACDNAVHRSQRLAVKPLKSSDWPSDPLGPSWPSFPSIPEWMEMCRKGLDPFARKELETPVGDAGYTSVSRRETQENPVLMTKIVTNAIVGIRSTEEIPGKYLKYFSYAGNFLILTHRFNLPIGLVRFLTSKWILKPFSLWLRRSVLFKKFLKKVPSLLVKRARTRWCDLQLLQTHRDAASTTASSFHPDSQSEWSDNSSDLD
jgi:hypothetical protein